MTADERARSTIYRSEVAFLIRYSPFAGSGIEGEIDQKAYAQGREQYARKWTVEASTQVSSESSSVPGKDGEDPADERVERCHVVAQEFLCRSHCDLAFVGDQTGGELDVGLGRVHLG